MSNYLVSCPGRGAAFFTLLRRAGTHNGCAWTPDQQRTACALRRIRGTQTGQFTAKQYSKPAPPVLIKSVWLQPPSGPREGCDAFQEFIVGEGVPVRSE